MKNTKKKGFTIVELVIVIAVIAILAGVLIPTFSGVVEKANESKAMQEAKTAWTNYLIEQTDATKVVPENGKIVVDGKSYYVINGEFGAEFVEANWTVGTEDVYTTGDGADDIAIYTLTAKSVEQNPEA